MLINYVLTVNLSNSQELFQNPEGSTVASFNMEFRVYKKKAGWIKEKYFQKFPNLGETAIKRSLDHHNLSIEKPDLKTHPKSLLHHYCGSFKLPPVTYITI